MSDKTNILSAYKKGIDAARISSDLGISLKIVTATIEKEEGRDLEAEAAEEKSFDELSPEDKQTRIRDKSLARLNALLEADTDETGVAMKNITAAFATLNKVGHTTSEEKSNFNFDENDDDEDTTTDPEVTE